MGRSLYSCLKTRDQSILVAAQFQVTWERSRLQDRRSSAAPAAPAPSRSSLCQNLDPSPALSQFADPLPVPLSINLSDSLHQHLTLGAYKIMQKLHRDLSATPMYAFGASQLSASVPGPTLLATQHVPAYVRWENHIDDPTHILSVDKSIHWANPTHGGVPIVVHLHGGEVDSASDGHPDAWFTYKGDTGSSFSSLNHTYINEQLPMALWYHDHTIGITRLNVVAGLSGMYIITSQAEGEILPVGLPLVIQDKQFYEDGTINFPEIGIIPSYHENWCPEYYGDTMLANGKIWPYFKVLPQAYRFRILNACNARFLILSLDNPDVYFYQIGTDGGLLADPLNLTSITMAPAERVDVVIDFSGLANGASVILNNSGPTPFPSGDIYQMPPATYAIVKFIVDEEDGYTEGILDADYMSKMNFTSVLEEEKAMSEEDVVGSRFLEVVEWDDNNHMPLIFTLDNRTWEDAVVQTPIEGTTEIWELMNLRINAHPIHIHLVQFQVLNQQSFVGNSTLLSTCSFDIAYGEEGTCFIEAPREPYAYQRGWKDTVITWPATVTRVLIRFTQRDGSAFAFDPSKGPGYAWHCHIVDHEDNVMMRPFQVTPNNTLAALTRNTASTRLYV
ncbi:hypothetical protein GOP47_0023459 [Adiantum capillus-veneris]|uniref:Plastocyanin-like domain-containing protein n=1 Tax=Adiantum capillus-veneris TaxID=13818 RepID=A0A9D4Z4H1_ADICA|nr:hypothetical protein GOP47_0023459 [Adiantum capillus-veneris]